MKKKSKSDIIKITIILVAVAIISSSVTKTIYLFNEKNSIYSIEEVNTTFKVGKHIEFTSSSPSSLDFGMTLVGGKVNKNFVLSNSYTKPLKVQIAYTGTIAEVLSYIEPFILEPNTSKNVTITAYSMTNETTNYTGTIKVIFLKI